MSKVGVGVITCNRQDFYEKCLHSIKKCNVDEIVTVNDGAPYKKIKGKVGKYIQHKENKGVGITKNEAFKHLLKAGCEHIFLVEDDIVVNNTDVFVKYIDTSEKSGLKHLMFGYHGPANKDPQTKKPKQRVTIQYTDDCAVALNTHCVGAFCYYHKSVLDNVGLMDEQFKNAWEHVEHSLQLVKAGYIPAYWWWPDVANSYLDELACSEENSTIRWDDPESKIPKEDWLENIEKGAQYFYSKHTFYPTTIPHATQEGVIAKLKQIKEQYSCHEV